MLSPAWLPPKSTSLKGIGFSVNDLSRRYLPRSFWSYAKRSSRRIRTICPNRRSGV
jgi:hypothetical protein